MGAAYGSLLAPKMLFGGHKIHHVCLPAEADLINAEGFKVQLPVRGRKDPVLLEFAQAARQGDRGGASASIPKDYDLVGLAMQEPQYRSPGVRELLDAVAKSQSALHVDHEHAAAALREAHPRPRLRRAQARLYRSDRVGQFRSRLADAVQSRSAGDPPAGRQGQRAARHAADQLQGRASSTTTRAPRSCASSRRTSTRCASIRATASRSNCR